MQSEALKALKNTNTQNDIPFNKSWISGDEYRYWAQAVDQGHISGDGPLFQQMVAKHNLKVY